MEVMHVIKRDNSRETVSFDKIANRFKKLINGDSTKKPLKVDPFSLTQKICGEMYSGVHTHELDELAAQTCASLITDCADFGVLASRLAISNHHKKTSPSFSETIQQLYHSVSSQGKDVQLITKELYNTVMKHKLKFNQIIDYTRDYNFDYFGFKTLEKSYLMKVNGNIVERPQHLLLRVALGIYGSDVKSAIECYNALSNKKYIHATPTLFNAGTMNGQLASCFLMGINDDSIIGIYDSLKDTALISKSSGGIGIHIHNIRSRGSSIGGGTGTSSGIVPMLRVFNNTAKYVDQGGGKRNGSFAIYLEPWHADITEFLNLRKNQGFEENRARDLFYALWIPDLFMERVRDGGNWTLMCPHICPGLSDVYGDEFVKKYTDYEKAGLGTSLPARELWFQILESQVETGTPYILFKDSCNRKSNQKNLGTIKSSNLCCVTPDTKILTKKGYYNINELENQDVEVWNGKSWSATRPMKTGDNKKVLTVKFSNNMEIKCTEYHKFYIEESSRPADKTKPAVVEAKDLCPGMRVIRYSIEMGEQSSIEMKYPYTSGLFSADGTYAVHNETPKRCSFKCKEGENFCKRHLNNNNKAYDDDTGVCSENSYETRPLLYLYGKKKSLVSHVSYKRITENSERVNLELPIDIDDKYKVPINYSLNTKLRWLEGLFDGDGCVVENNGIKNLQLGSIHKKFLDDVFFLLQTLGIVSTISLAQPERMTNMPNGKNEYKEVKCKTLYRTNVDCENLIKLKKLGFSPKRLDIDNIRSPHHKTNKFIKITEIQDNDEYSDTYCFNEPNEHKGIFNGILTGQCEIVEYSGPDETAVCNLASISLSSYVVKPDVPGKIVITGIDNCVYCKLAYSWCERWRLNFEYTKVNAEKGKKYPIIEVKDDEKVIHSGGFTEFIEAYPVNYDHVELAEMTRQLTRNLNKVIDKSSYPIESARRSNIRHRPIGIGVQGLSDVFMRMRIPFDSEKAKKVNDKIFETIYYASMQESMRLAKKKHDKKKPNDAVKYPGAYSSFEGSPLEQGKFQFDLWEQQPSQEEPVYDWEELRNEIKTYGVLNSLVTCEMPTASSSQILGNNECIEPITSNIYVRRTLAGEFIVVNKYLQEDMEDLGIWNKELKDKILLHEGSVQNIPGIPQLLKDCYKTVWEMSQKVLIDLSADRGKYVCQSQSLNLFVAEPKFDVLTSMLLYTWSKGLKT